jgi:hypothetical protein
MQYYVTEDSIHKYCGIIVNYMNSNQNTLCFEFEVT